MVEQADATAGLWRRLARPFDVREVADALMGLQAPVVDALAAMRLCLSPQATALLDAMPGLSRSLTTSVSSQSVRSRGEVRGPVLWSETISARASSSGDEDLFVCSAPQRDYDTPANRALVRALRDLAGCGRAFDRVPASWRDDPRIAQARTVSRRARHWVEHPSLSRVSDERVSERDQKRVRGGKSAARYIPALDVLALVSEPLGAAELVPMCDRRTRLQHWVLLAAMRELETRGLALPSLRVEGRAMIAGPLTYVHARNRQASGGLHGIVLGHVLIDVAEPPRPADDPSVEAMHHELVTRSGGRQVVLIRDYRDVQSAVDYAVRHARNMVGTSSASNA